MAIQEVKVGITSRSTRGLPRYETPGAAGMDIRAWLPEGARRLKPMERALIPTGLSIELPEGWEAQIRPRSGLAFRKGLTVVNAPGTIDSDYRGDIGILLINLGGEELVIEDGDRIAQMVVCPVGKVCWEERDELDRTERGAGGLGHTGV